MQTRKILFISSLTALLTLTACSKKTPAPQPADGNTPASVPAARIRPSEAPSKPSQPAGKGQLGAAAAPLDGLVWVKGQPVSFQPKKVYVVEFWATWCGPCRQSIPHLTEIQKQFKDKGVTVIGISDESVDTVRPFVEKMGGQMDYTVAIDKSKKVGRNYMEAYGQNGIPTAFIVDGSGRIVWLGHPLDGMDEVLAQVVEGTFDSAAWAQAQQQRQELERQIGDLFRQYFTGLESSQPSEQTRLIAEQIIEKAPAGALNEMAWAILTEVDQAQRDYAIALKAAEKANTLAGGKDASILDTYGLALFKNGKIAEAVAVQTKAVELAAGNEAMLGEFKSRLEQFKAAAAQ